MILVSIYFFGLEERVFVECLGKKLKDCRGVSNVDKTVI